MSRGLRFAPLALAALLVVSPESVAQQPDTAHRATDRADTTGARPIMLAVPILDWPDNFANGRTLPTMQQSLALTRAFYQLGPWAINQASHGNAAGGLLLGASPQRILLAQSPSCRPASERAENLIGYVRGLASATDSATAARRALWHIPAMPPDSIVFVDREPVRLRAARVYEQYVPDHQRHVARRVWVIKAGNVFIVSDPTVHIGEWGLTLVLDSRFRFLRSFL